jgi:uncharacterized repeat protein (TIGR03803 family)
MKGGENMLRHELEKTFVNSMVLVAVVMLATGTHAATREKILYTLKASQGIAPAASLIIGADGTLYGTASAGGAHSCGTVFALSPGSDGWSESTIYDFACGSSDGKGPQSALTFDGTGNLYGTTVDGGSQNCGIVFELTPLSSGGWSETVLHSFGSENHGIEDGCHPYSSLLFDRAGALYGTTSAGGGGFNGGSCVHGCGTVFRLAPKKAGPWIETVIHRFPGKNRDGENPFAGLVMDNSDNLYGTTSAGGAVFAGTVFRLTPHEKKWEEVVIHSFQGGRDGANPYAGLAFDEVGALYGTTLNGGSSGVGTVFRLAVGSNGRWKENVAHNFIANDVDGFFPIASVTFDASGVMYGITEFGGHRSRGQKGAGTVFKLTRSAGGRWGETVVFDFSDREYANQMQRNPIGALAFDGNGNLFGTAQPILSLGGVIFEVTP